MLLNPKRPCPVCGMIVSNAHPVGKPYKCANCGAELQERRQQNKAKGSVDLFVAFAIAWVFGARGWMLPVATAFLFIAVLVIAVPAWERIWPTRLEPWDGKRVI